MEEGPVENLRFDQACVPGSSGPCADSQLEDLAREQVQVVVSSREDRMPSRNEWSLANRIYRATTIPSGRWSQVHKPDRDSRRKSLDGFRWVRPSRTGRWRQVADRSDGIWSRFQAACSHGRLIVAPQLDWRMSKPFGVASELHRKPALRRRVTEIA